MASESGSEDQGNGSHGPRECMACRGSGRVISNLGGTPSEVKCPWCEGAGMRVPGIDAQAHSGERADAPTPTQGEDAHGAEAPSPEPAAEPSD